jgi:hypothetical protein
MSFKPFEGHFGDTVGMNRAFIGSGIKEMAESGNSVADAVESFWNQDYRGFSHLGAGATGMFSGMSNIVSSAAFGAGAMASRSSYGLFGHAAMQNSKGETLMNARRGWTSGRTVVEEAGFIEKVGHKGNGFWAKHVNGDLQHTDGRLLQGPAATRMGAELKPVSLFSKQHPMDLMAGKSELAASDFLAAKNGFALGKNAGLGTRMLRGLGSPMGVGLMVGATILGTMAVGKVTSVAGGLMDEAHLAYQQNKYAHYDTRDFNNRATNNWGMNAMGAMQGYEQNNMSIARAYHSRG